MNCKHVEELLPLYIGRDLEEERARLVTAHVQICTECARSVEEYGGANQLLRLFEPPQFSEATYAAVRSHVLREIEGQSITPQSIFALNFLRRSFEPRLMWAVSTGVLLAVCVFAYYFIANRTTGEQGPARIAVKPDAGERHITGKQENAGLDHVGPKPPPASSREGIKPDITGTAGVPPALESRPRKSRLNPTTQAVLHPKRAGGSPVVTERTAQVFPEPKGPDTSATADKTLRLEIQTSDRNIRIIWFSHPRTNEGSPIEPSKGI